MVTLDCDFELCVPAASQPSLLFLVCSGVVLITAEWEYSLWRRSVIHLGQTVLSILVCSGIVAFQVGGPGTGKVKRFFDTSWDWILDAVDTILGLF